MLQLRLLIAIAVVAGAQAAIDCYSSEFEPAKGQCMGFKVKTSLCMDVATPKDGATQSEVTTKLFGGFVSEQLGSQAQCSAYWTPHCMKVGGTKALDDKSCVYNCGLLQKASVQCAGPGTCKAVTPASADSIPTGSQIQDLAMSLTCCSWVNSTLQAVCDKTDATKLDKFITDLLTTPVAYTGSGKINNMCTNDAACITPSIARDTSKCNAVMGCIGGASSISAPVTLLAAAATAVVAAMYRF